MYLQLKVAPGHQLKPNERPQTWFALLTETYLDHDGDGVGLLISGHDHGSRRKSLCSVHCPYCL